MAQKRMVDKKISVSEQVANLTIEAQLIFTWSILHADDLGLLPKSLRTLRAMVVPMLDMNLETFGNHVESIVRQGLIEEFRSGDQEFYRIPKFLKHQTLKKDRKPVTELKNVSSWDDVEDIGFQLEDIGNPREGKGREDKGREGKGGGRKATVPVDSTTPAPLFEEFWGKYPKKIKKNEAKTAWMYQKMESLSRESFERILNFCASAALTDAWQKGFIPNPDKFISGKRWEDDLATYSDFAQPETQGNLIQ